MPPQLAGRTQYVLQVFSGLLLCIFVHPLSLGFRAKRHRRGSFYSIHPCRIGLPSGNMTVTSCFLNTTVQFASQMGPIPISVFVNVGMMYPIVGKSTANCGIGSVAFSVDVTTCPFDVPTMILLAFVSIEPCGAFGAIYRRVAPESTIPVCSGRRLFLFSSNTYVLLVGLQLELSSYIKLSLKRFLSTTVLAAPTCH